MKFQVPQFIETETKIIGPFTLKQFLFIAGGVSMIAMEYIVLSGMLFLIFAFITAAFFGSLAFVKVDGQPFINYLAYMIGYSLGSKQYLYKPKTDQSSILPPSVSLPPKS